MTDGTVVVGACGDSGPYGSYWRAPDGQQEQPAPEGSMGFATFYFRVHESLWDEYARLCARMGEIETEFCRIGSALNAESRGTEVQ